MYGLVDEVSVLAVAPGRGTILSSRVIKAMQCFGIRAALGRNC